MFLPQLFTDPCSLGAKKPSVAGRVQRLVQVIKLVCSQIEPRILGLLYGWGEEKMRRQRLGMGVGRGGKVGFSLRGLGGGRLIRLSPGQVE